MKDQINYGLLESTYYNSGLKWKNIAINNMCVYEWLQITSKPKSNVFQKKIFTPQGPSVLAAPVEFF